MSGRWSVQRGILAEVLLEHYAAWVSPANCSDVKSMVFGLATFLFPAYQNVAQALDALEARFQGVAPDPMGLAQLDRLFPDHEYYSRCSECGAWSLGQESHTEKCSRSGKPMPEELAMALFRYRVERRRHYGERRALFAGVRMRRGQCP